MSATNVDVIRWGRERARAGPWRGDSHVAYLAPVPDAPAPSATFVRRCLDLLAERGFRRVVTGALAPSEQAGFIGAGFVVAESLHLLSHDLTAIPDRAAIEHRRARPADRPGVLALDHLSFPEFWRLDGRGLDDALAATPRSRFRVTMAESAVVGYAVVGRAGRRGYVQRLAVHPDHRHGGLGTGLVVDGLRWLRRWRVERAVVNTQLGNAAALALYESIGFRREPLGLSVLSAGIDQ